MSSKNYNFKGKIINTIGMPLKGYTIEIIKTNPLSLAEDKVVKEINILKSDGTFNIDISDNFDKKGVILKILDKNGKEVSRITNHKVKEKNEMNLKLENAFFAKIERDESFLKIRELINSKLDTNQPEDIKKIKNSLTDDGIMLLAEETKLSSEMIKMHIDAEKMGTVEIPSEFSYALLKDGVDKNEIFSLPLYESMEIYRAEQENNVDIIDENKFNEIKENVLKKTNEMILKKKNPNSLSTIGKMLDLTTKNQENQIEILTILYHTKNDEEDRWKILEEKFLNEPKIVKDLKFNMQLGDLTMGNAPLIKKLRTQTIKKGNNNVLIESKEDLIRLGLYEKEKWKPFIEGNIAKDKEDAYISTMIKQLEKEFPARIMAREITDGKIPIEDKDGKIYEILTQPSFKLAQKGISHYEKSGKITDKKDGEDREAFRNEFGKLNRVFSLTNNRAMMKTLFEKGFDSAFKIVESGQNAFLSRFPKKEQENAKKIFIQAKRKQEIYNQLWISKETTLRTPMPNAISTKSVKKNPDLEELFGDLDFCFCGHCESVLSPAAYLVDLLEFLKDDEVVKKLLEKRPDIEHIELTCTNTETVLPYIDLVNEVLEYWVVNSKLNEFKGNSVDTESSESLLAEPAHVQDKAYEILAQEIFPLSLPFDREKKLEQSFLSSVGTSRLEILNLLNKEPIDDKVTIQEKLNMNEKLYKIFTESKDADVAELYGFDKSINLNETLSNAKLFCRHLNLEYEELIWLLKTEFINVDKNISLIYEKVTDVSNMYKCNFSELKITKYKEEVVGGDNPNKVTLLPLEQDVFFKLILFIRLYKHIGWSIEEVDLLLTNTKNKTFNEIPLKITFINDLKNLLSFSDNRHLSALLSLLDKDSEEGKKKILASFLKIDVSTLEDWIALVGIKPFEWKDEKPLIIDFIQKMQDLQSVGVELSELNYLFRDIDKTDKSRITMGEIMTVQNLIFEEYKSIEELSKKKLEQVNEEKKVVANKVKLINTLAKEIEVLTSDIEQLTTEKKTDEVKSKKISKEDKIAELNVEQIDEKLYKDRLKELNIQIETEKKLTEILKESTIPKILSEHLQSDIRMVELLLKRIPLIENGFLLIGENDIVVSYFNKVSGNSDSEIKNEKIKNINFDGKEIRFPKKTDLNADYVQASFSFSLDLNKVYELIWEISDHLSIEIKIDDEVQKLSEKILIEENRVQDIKIIVSNIRNENDSFKLFYKKEEDEEKNLLSSKKVNKKEYGQLLKSLQWINKMNLTLLETDYFMKKETIAKLPILKEILDESLSFLVSQLLTISKYQKIKKELNISNDDLVKFLLAPSETYLFEKEKCSTFYQFVSWDKEDVNKLLAYYNEGLETLRIDQLFKYTNIFILSNNSGLSIDNLLKIANDKLTVEKLKNALKTKYDSVSWLKLLKNTYNPMRTAQRDALVSYVLSKLKSNEDTDHINTQDKLFEYFLIDVAMDSCMQTSRIKQAISSVQLFVHRCLYNLEAVSPSSINLEKWEWAKNYRVWEANRKLFLYPENWLDPSLRSTKTPFFKELEGELLQSDINEDLATKALLTYLEKVDRVSHLEVCGMCKEDDSERIHVIGRTSGIKRVYYHRTYDGTWSPWEQVVLDLEDGPVIPVFWKGRLFLYWITTLQKGERPNMETQDDAAKASPKYYVEVNLNWSEYYNNKWQEKRTSDFNESIKIYLKDEEFNKNHIKLEYLVEGEKLLIGVSKNEVYYGHYTFYNTQSLPEIFTLNRYQVKRNHEDIKKEILEEQENIEVLKDEIPEIENSDKSKEDKASYIKNHKRDIKYHESRLLDLNNYTVMKFSTDIKQALSYSNQKLLLKNNYMLTEFSNPTDCISSAPFFVNDRDNSFFVQKDTESTLLWINSSLSIKGINHD